MKKIYISLSLFFVSNLGVFSQSIPSNIPTDSLLGYWPFDNNANDISSKKFHGDVINVVPTKDRFGKENSAYEFNGKNSRIEINHEFFNIGSPNYTISMWMNTNSLNNPNNQNDSQTLLNTDEHNGIGIGIHGSNNPFGNIYTNKFSLAIGSKPNIRDWDILGKHDNESILEVSTNEWFHYVLVKKDTFNYFVYLNGKLDKSFKVSTNSDSVLTKLVFGALAKKIATTESEESFMGKLDDYAIWNRALSETEIKKVHSETAFLSEVKENNFEIYPNPSTGDFVLKTEGLQKGFFTITDLEARRVYESSISNQETHVNISPLLSKGIYYLNLFDTQNQSLTSRKIIIN